MTGAPVLPSEIAPPDFYIAAMGRSGSTMICNWLTHAPEQLVFIEPSFHEAENTRLLRIQLANFGMPVGDEEWAARNESARERFARLMSRRLSGRRWALKEVLCAQHLDVIERMTPKRIVISVRNIHEVALSFFEKHRKQDNLDRFSDDWVADYCKREAHGLVQLRDMLMQRQIAHHIIRYEDFTRGNSYREDLSSFVEWRGGGNVSAHFDDFDRTFEIERHGHSVSPYVLNNGDRLLEHNIIELAHTIEEQCNDYQLAFGYK